jgi:hypothetical protein
LIAPFGEGGEPKTKRTIRLTGIMTTRPIIAPPYYRIKNIGIKIYFVENLSRKQIGRGISGDVGVRSLLVAIISVSG